VGDQALVSRLIDEHGIDSILHFAAKIVVPESVTDPLAYYLNNTVKTRALIETAVTGRRKNFIFSSTAAVYGNAECSPPDEDCPLRPSTPTAAASSCPSGCSRTPTAPTACAT
jgi:UDP-glucose 4-epimerase